MVLVNGILEENRVFDVPGNIFLKRMTVIRNFQNLILILFILSTNALAQLNGLLPFSSVSDSTHDYKCGFPDILEANSPANTEIFKEFQQLKMTASQYDSVYISPSGHFKIFYNTEGIYTIPDYDRDQNGIPDYLEFVAMSFDRAWFVEIDSLGFKPPPDSSGNFREVYPVHCRLIGEYGVTWLDYEIPARPNLNYVTYIEINTNFNFVNYPNVTDPIVRDSMAIAVTAAHEFNHAIQTGYRLWPDDEFFHDIWFIESSATFMEEVVAPEVNDYLQYLDDYFRKAHQPLDQSGGSLDDYGKVVLEILLGEQYPTEYIRKTWEQIENQRALPALETVVSEMQGNLSAEFGKLCAWLYFTNERAVAGQYFPDAALFPEARFLAGDPVENLQKTLKSGSLPRLSFQWYASSILENVPLQLHLKATQGSNASRSLATLIPWLGTTYLQFPASTTYRIDLSSSQLVLPVGIVNSRLYGDDYFNYEIISNPFTPQSLSEVRVFPQPLILSNSQLFLQFKNLPENSTISIFNSQGSHVITLYTPEGEKKLTWNLKNEHGHLVGGGVYIFHVKSSSIEQQGKFVVIH
jgi:hypothetical protein